MICLFTTEPNIVILFASYTLSVKNLTTNTFDEIAQLTSTPSAAFLPGGEYLRDRVRLNVSFTSTTSGQATISFQTLTCDDEKEYKCDVFITKSGQPLFLSGSATANISVQASTLKPVTVSELNSTLAEGQNVAFKCDGNVGKPPGRYIWQKIRKNNGELATYENVITVPTQFPHSCTYHGTSILSIALAAEDNQAFMRCAVKSMASLYKDSELLNVLYKVKKPTITKHPNQTYYLVGSGDIELKCYADGNPKSYYAWFKDDNRDLTLSSNAQLVIDSKNATNNGTYICHAFNSLNGKNYNDSQLVDIFIVYDIPTSISTFTSPIVISPAENKVYQQPWFWISIILLIVIILLSVGIVHLFRTRVPKANKTAVYCDIPGQTLENHRYDIIMSSSNTLNNADYEDTGILSPYYGVNRSDKTVQAADENKTAMSVTSFEETNITSPYTDIDEVSLTARKTYENTMI